MERKKTIVVDLAAAAVFYHLYFFSSLSLSPPNFLYIHYFSLFLYTNLMRKCTEVETHTYMHVVTNRFFILQIVLLLIFLPISAKYIYNKKKIIITIPLVTLISLSPNHAQMFVAM